MANKDLSGKLHESKLHPDLYWCEHPSGVWLFCGNTNVGGRLIGSIPWARLRAALARKDKPAKGR